MGGQSQAEKVLAGMTRDFGSNLYLYQILEETPNGVMVVSIGHQVIYANPAACHFLDMPCEDIVDASIAEVLDVENAGLFRLIADFLNSPPAGRCHSSGTRSRSRGKTDSTPRSTSFWSIPRPDRITIFSI